VQKARSVSKRKSVAKRSGSPGVGSSSAQRAADSPRSRVMLSGAEETIADAVADMLVSGSTEENLSRLIHATISHEYRQRFRTFNEEQLNESIGGIQQRQTKEMLDDLATFKTRRLDLRDSERPEPKDIVERVRESVRGECSVEMSLRRALWKRSISARIMFAYRSVWWQM